MYAVDRIQPGLIMRGYHSFNFTCLSFTEPVEKHENTSFHFEVKQQLI